MRVDDIVRDEVQTLGVGLTKGSNLFGPVTATSTGVPRDAVFVTIGGGGSPQRTMTDDQIRQGIVNIFVRWQSYNEGAQKAQDILDGLQGRRPPGLLDIVAQDSEPPYIGQTEEGFHQWNMNFRVVRNVDA